MIPQLDYMVIGSPKSGTTTLCKLLDKHPDVFITNPKEPLFFCPSVFMKTRNWEWYSNLFSSVTTQKIIGEGTVNYTTSDYRMLVDPQIIFDLYPNIKLLYMVRDPIERIESHWLNCAIMGWPSDLPDFNSAVRNCSFLLNTSRYFSHINRYKRFFPEENIHVIFFEDFIQNQSLEMDKVFEFLGVDSLDYLDNNQQAYNQSSTHLYRDGMIMRSLRKSGLVSLVRKILPVSLRHAIVPYFKEANTERPVWDKEVLNWVINEIKDDSYRFLESNAKPRHYWKSLKID